MEMNLIPDIQDVLTDPQAQRLYDALTDEYQTQYGPPTETAALIIRDICVMEQTKQQLLEDVRKRGVMEKVVNGRQSYWRENKSISAAKQLADQQRKHLAELKLTPASKKGQQLPLLDDDFESF